MLMPSTAAGPPPPTPAGWRARLARQARRCALLARQHWLLTLLLAAGLVLRVVAQIAYQPALYYIDSMKYLFGAYPGNDPPGYQILIKPLLAVADPSFLAAVQHVAGLAMAVALYAVLIRRGVPRWLSALATAPILLDAYQLQIEQSIMPDVLFEALIVTAIAALLWRPRLTTPAIITAGLALRACATARQVGEIFILPTLLYLLITLPRWRQLLRGTAIACAAFALPILVVSYRDYAVIHRFGLAPYASGSIYGRVAAAADCPALKIPAYERALCPTVRQQLNGPDWLDHHFGSPIKYFQAPPGMSTGAVVSDFSHQVILQQPTGVLTAVGKDALKLFAVHRVTAPGDTPISRWQFQPVYPQYPPYMTIAGGQVMFHSFTPTGAVRWVWSAEGFGGGSPRVVRPLASFLHTYQLDGGYTPGPLLAFAVLAGLAGTLSLLRRHATPAGRDAARACLLTFTAATSVLLMSDAFEFTWRYQLPALITLPPTAALALTALLTHRHQTTTHHPSTTPTATAPAATTPAAGAAAT